MIRGFPALVILPKLGEPSVVPGFASWVLLKKLKNSARYCRRQRSVIGMFLSTEKSTLKVPGPTNIFLPALPNVPRAAGANELVVNHCAMRSPRDPDVYSG